MTTGTVSRLEEYGRMAKPRAIEEVGDIYLIRPLGFLIVQVLRHTTVTPTMVSFLAVLAGWWTAWIYYRSNLAGGDVGLALLAALTFLFHSALDSADGQLARVTGRTSPLGRLVDGFCDSLAFLSIYVAIVMSFWARSQDYRITVALLAAAAVYTHSLQSSLTEYQRTLYLYCVHGKRDIIDSDPRNMEKAARREGSLFAWVLHTLHIQYYRQQRVFLPSTARLERYVTDLLARLPRNNKDVAAIYDRRQRPTMPGWALLAPNSHKIAIILSAFLPLYGGSFWGGLGMGWYLIYDLGLNAVMVWLIRRQGPVNEGTMEELRRLDEGK